MPRKFAGPDREVLLNAEAELLESSDSEWEMIRDAETVRRAQDICHKFFEERR